MTAPLTIFKDKITCGTWTFNDPMTLPTGVTQLGINILDGWDDTMPVQMISTSRGSRDGDVPSDHFPARARQVTLSGWMYCTSRTAARLAWSSLVSGAFPLDTDLTLTRFEPDRTKQLTVRRSGSIELPPTTNLTGPHFRFLVPLMAFDPLKYSSTVDINATTGIAGLASGGVVAPVVAPIVVVSTSGQQNQLSVNNIGSYTTRPVSTITGPLSTGWHYDNSTSGVTIGLDVSLGNGDQLVLDHAAETAMLNSVEISPAIVGQWWGLPPGPNVLKLYGNYDPAATVTVVGRSAWE